MHRPEMVRAALQHAQKYLNVRSREDAAFLPSERDLRQAPLARLAEMADGVGLEIRIREVAKGTVGSLEHGELIAWNEANGVFAVARKNDGDSAWRLTYLDGGPIAAQEVASDTALEEALTGSSENPTVGLLGDRLTLRTFGKQAEHTPRTWDRLLEWVRLERRDYLGILIYAVIVGLLTLAVPAAVQALLDIVAFRTLWQPLVVLGALLLTALAFSGGLRLAQMMLVELIGRRFFMKAVQDFSTRLVRAARHRAPYRDYNALANRLFDAATIEKGLPLIAIDGLGAVLQLAVGLSLLALYHPWLLVFSFTLALAAGLLLWATWKRGEVTAVKESAHKHAIATWMQGITEKHATVRSAQGHALAQAQLAHLILDWNKSRRSHFSVVWRQNIVFVALQTIASVLLLVGGGFLVMRGELTLGQLIAAEIVMAVSVGSLTKIGKLLPKIYDVFAAMDKAGHVFDLELSSNAGVDYDYRSDGGSVLRLQQDEQTFMLGRGEKRVVVANPMFEDALQRLRHGTCPSRLNFTIGGEPVERSVTEKDGLLLLAADQFLPAPVRDNITLGALSADPSVIAEALRAVGLQETVGRLPDGLNTVLTHAGGPLSVSDLARLSIARGLLAKHRVLVIDRALDVIPPEDAHRCLEALWRLDTTILCITAQPHLADFETVRFLHERETA